MKFVLQNVGWSSLASEIRIDLAKSEVETK